MNFIKNEDGAALLSVLLLVSVMSAAMVTTFDVLGFYTRQTVTKSHSYQATQYALAAEIIGANEAVDLAKNSELVALLGQSGNPQKVSFPFENGTVTGTLEEYTNCFNLSSVVVAGSGDGFELNQTGYDQYIKLLEELGIGERQAISLASALVDWQDTDDRPMPSGAEGFVYSQMEVPYRAANYPITEIRELRLVRGYNSELVDRLGNLSCVDKRSMMTTINLNSAKTEDASLINALLGLSLSQQDVVTILKARPETGYDHVARFWDHGFLKDRKINSQIRQQFLITPKRYKIGIDVSLDGARVKMESLVYINDDGTFDLISRKFGV